MASPTDSPPREFQQILASISRAPAHPHIALQEVPAPSRLAPFAVAISADAEREGLEVASGRIVVGFDPEEHPAWGGTTRIIALTKAIVEPEVARDDLWAHVAWSWLEDALAPTDCHHLGGTVTKVVNEGFGSGHQSGTSVTVEMRATWSPGSTDIAPHIEAWQTLLASFAGIPPLPDGVTPLGPARA